jgi:hypothetical protein
MIRAFDDNSPRQMASEKSHMDPTGKNKQGMMYDVMAGWGQRGNGKKRRWLQKTHRTRYFGEETWKVAVCCTNLHTYINCLCTCHRMYTCCSDPSVLLCKLDFTDNSLVCMLYDNVVNIVIRIYAKISKTHEGIRKHHLHFNGDFIYDIQNLYNQNKCNLLKNGPPEKRRACGLICTYAA